MVEFDALDARDTPAGVEFALKAAPGASRDRIVGLLGDALKVAVSAAPEGGKANEAIVRLLADTLGVRRSDVSIVSGCSQRTKRVAVRGVDASWLRRRIAGVLCDQ